MNAGKREGSTELPPPDAAFLRRTLLRWYDATRRPLPWRERPSPYGVWISEIMLQQTTVATVVTRWRAFLARFPDAASLAAAEQSEVLAAWSGLGYYSRARSLHAAARAIVAAGGRLPRDAAGWRALPGVGPYTAGAIASIALGERVPAVDTNAARVLLRLYCADASAAEAMKRAALAELAGELVDPRRPGDWNQSLMELGATICLPERPDCAACPVAAACRARSAGAVARIPPAAVRPAPVPVVLSLLIVTDGDRVLVAPPGSEVAARLPGLGDPVREDFAGLFKGLWGLPTTPWYARPPEAAAPEFAAAWAGALPRLVAAVRPHGAIRHAVTRFRLLATVCAAEPRSAFRIPRGWRWWSSDLPLGALSRKALRRAGVSIEI